LPMTGLAEVPLGSLLYEQDELDAAKQHLVDGIARCQQLGTTSYTLFGLRTLARLRVVQGATNDGFHALLEARQLAAAAEDDRRARQVIATTVELHLRVGNPAGAEQALHELPGGWECSSEYEQLTRARLLLAQHNPESALGALADLEQRA